MMIENTWLLMATLLTSFILMAMPPILMMWLCWLAPLPIPGKLQAGPRLVWVIMALCLFFWGTVIQFTLDQWRLSLLSCPRFQPAVISRFSLSSLPYRAYLLSCCLLD
jgi:hypothetical protein